MFENNKFVQDGNVVREVTQSQLKSILEKSKEKWDSIAEYIKEHRYIELTGEKSLPKNKNVDSTGRSGTQSDSKPIQKSPKTPKSPKQGKGSESAGSETVEAGTTSE